ncbi:MAG: S1 RNA-binding domain-containing protein [Armatimonadetes bacterium]|nr:S1 RNA-binding domain-containing protein [Armatimonadota bacterium]
MPLEVGSIVDGVITGITRYGAFIELPDKSSVLVHISEISNDYVEDINKILKEKDPVKVKILKVNYKGQYDLSIKQADLEKETKFKNKTYKHKEEPSSFEDKLTKFLKESEERLLDLKRNVEAKRGGRSRLR